MRVSRRRRWSQAMTGLNIHAIVNARMKGIRMPRTGLPSSASATTLTTVMQNSVIRRR